MNERAAMDHLLPPEPAPDAQVRATLLLWGWIWGVVGALMAVPILMTLEIFCDHIGSLHAIGEFVSGKPIAAGSED